ncbi:helix-turn-helix transcriptional regulator [Streptococcus mitis]|jgi:helix-turn-helix family protein|uniref:Cro/Cl family transcriptional regulator n=1 Tax=Streptococcus mitis TaxID=28037 RepID=A0A1X1KBI7_STRMT|nr:helix-turn-helix transcriptional regulator [Streptococcus mitis]ORO96651.1 Cro/Cl family transcriptional regulator [Streptococcus mitis]
MSNRLKKLRKEKGLTQADLAKVLNTNQSQYGKYENGKTNLSIENAKILAEYFGVSIPYLLGYEENSTVNKPNATILIELVKELSFISEKKSKLLQEYIELDKKERDVLEQIRSADL